MCKISQTLKTLVLDGLALGRRSAAGDSATYENEELLGVCLIEIADVGDVGSFGEDDWIWSFGSALENKQGGYLHSSCVRWKRGERGGGGSWKEIKFWSRVVKLLLAQHNTYPLFYDYLVLKTIAHR